MCQVRLRQPLSQHCLLLSIVISTLSFFNFLHAHQNQPPIGVPLNQDQPHHQEHHQPPPLPQQQDQPPPPQQQNQNQPPPPPAPQQQNQNQPPPPQQQPNQQLHRKAQFASKDQINDVDHLKEHYKQELGYIQGEISEEKRQWLYFRLYDINKDNLIDGLEMCKALRHSHDHSHHAPETNEILAVRMIVSLDSEDEEEVESEEFVEERVDELLQQMDASDDGFVQWMEFRTYLNDYEITV